MRGHESRAPGEGEIMGFGKRPRLIHSLPCADSPATRLPNRRVFIQQIPSVDLFAKYIEQKLECTFFRCNFCKCLLFFLISRYHQTKFFCFPNALALVGPSGRPSTGSRRWGPATPHFTPEKFQRHIPGSHVAGPFLRATRELTLPPLRGSPQPPSRTGRACP